MSRLASRPSFAILVLAAFLGAVIVAVAPAGAFPWGVTQIATVNPSAADVVNAKDRPVDDTEEASTGASITTTTVNVMAAVADVTFHEMVAQNFRIINTHGSQALCLKTVDRALSTTSCSSACGALAAGAVTCAGAGAADGIYLPGASLIPFSYSIKGTECLCAEASGAATTYQVTRVARSSNL